MALINCLEYALLFWEKNPTYRIHYNSDHCINLPTGSIADGFLPAEDYGYDYFKGSFTGLLSEKAEGLLKKYFDK